MDGGLQHPVVPAEHSNWKKTIKNMDGWAQKQLSDPCFARILSPFHVLFRLSKRMKYRVLEPSLDGGSTVDLVFSVTPSSTGGLDLGIGSDIIHVPKYLSAHHPVIQMVLLATYDPYQIGFGKNCSIFRCPESMAPEIVIDMAKRSYYPAKGFHALYEHKKMIAGRAVDGEFILSNKVHQSVRLPESQSEGRNGASNEGISCKGNMTGGNGGSNSVNHPFKDSAASLNLARTDTISPGRKRKLDGAIDNKCVVVGCGVSGLAAADSVNKVALLQERNNAWLQPNDGTTSNLAPIISSGQGDIRDLGGEMNVVSSEVFSKGSRSTIERSGSETEETNMLIMLVQQQQQQTQQQQQQQQQGTLNEGSNTSGLSSLPCEVGAFKASAVTLNAIAIKDGSEQQGNAITIKCDSVDTGRLAANDVQGCLNVTLPPRLWAISEPGEPPEHDSNAAKRIASSMTWLVATAAPHHATGNRALLSGYTPEHSDLFLQAAVGGAAAPMRVLGRGAVVTDAVKLPDVWYVPGLAANLVSVGQLAELGYSVAFGRGTCRVRSGGGGGDVVVGEGRAGEGGVFELDFLRVPHGM